MGPQDLVLLSVTWEVEADLCLQAFAGPGLKGLPGVWGPGSFGGLWGERGYMPVARARA